METKREVIEKLLFEELEKGPIADTRVWAEKAHVQHGDGLVGLLNAHSVEGGVLKKEQFKKEFWELTEDGERVLKEGAPEVQVFHAIPAEGGKTKKALQAEMGAVCNNGGFSEAMKNRWLTYDKATDTLKRAVAEVEDSVQKALAEIKAGRIPDKKEESVLKTRRKMIRFVSETSYKVELIGKLGEQKKLASDLTVAMLRSGAWKDAAFKQYNFQSLGSLTCGGYIHPLVKMRQQMRQIFLEMGFQEMETDNYVESSFWNFDSLFQPQQHPARDMHDTFFLADPRLADLSDCPADYRERVRATHEKGGDGSIGWRYKWSEEESRKNILRTHTTASSSRRLFRAVQDCMKKGEPFRPIKCFSIDRVFRNETVDATHLSEFHQVEGFIADYDVGLPQLLDTMITFFAKLGMTDLRFKPAFNPYTEPSMEVFAYHPALGKTIEIGNSGVFRPEMIRPMGVPKNVSVIAWGLSLERPTMILNGISAIRSLFGSACSLEYIRDASIFVLDK